MRLRRLLCGRALPFRNATAGTNVVRAGRAGPACAPNTDAQCVPLPGKPQAFRTAGLHRGNVLNSSAWRGGTPLDAALH